MAARKPKTVNRYCGPCKRTVKHEKRMTDVGQILVCTSCGRRKYTKKQLRELKKLDDSKK